MSEKRGDRKGPSKKRAKASTSPSKKHALIGSTPLPQPNLFDATPSKQPTQPTLTTPTQQSQEEDFRVILNIGGTIFETYASTLKKYPDTLLGSIFTNKPAEYFESKTVDEDHRFFFDRDPRVFESIINFYRTGKLVVPSWMPPQLLAEEIKFFALKLPLGGPGSPLLTQVDLVKDFGNIFNAVEYKRMSRAKLLEEHHNTLIQIVAEMAYKIMEAASSGCNFCDVFFYSPLHYTDSTPNFIFNVISRDEIRELILELFNEKGFNTEMSQEYSKTIIGVSDYVTNLNDPKKFSFSVKWGSHNSTSLTRDPAKPQHVQ